MTFKTLFIFFITIATALIAWALFASAQEPPPHVNTGHAYIITGKIGLEWLFYGETRVWIEAKTADKEGWLQDGWHPSFTVLISQYKPIVTQRSDGKYEITFTQGRVDMP